ncbi:hypothetical protein [Pedobacter sp. NJ-S-72]
MIYLLFVLFVVFGYKALDKKKDPERLSMRDHDDHSPVTNEEAAELANEPNHHHFEIYGEVLYHVVMGKRYPSFRTVKPMPGYPEDKDFKFPISPKQAC